jgi:hypothetical protein
MEQSPSLVCKSLRHLLYNSKVHYSAHETATGAYAGLKSVHTPTYVSFKPSPLFYIHLWFQNLEIKYILV